MAPVEMQPTGTTEEPVVEETGVLTRLGTVVRLERRLGRRPICSWVQTH